jgi:hypothetical protein
MSIYRREIGGLEVVTGDDQISIRYTRQARLFFEGVRVGLSLLPAFLLARFGVILWKGIGSGASFVSLLLPFFLVVASLGALWAIWRHRYDASLRSDRVNGVVEIRGGKRIPVRAINLVYGECGSSGGAFTLSLWDEKRQAPLWHAAIMGTPEEAEEIARLLGDFLGVHWHVRRQPAD